MKIKEPNKLFLSQSEAAEYLGISRSTLSAITTGAHGPVPEELQRIQLGNRWYYSRELMDQYARGGDKVS